jgi:hypothetical protein
MPAFTARMTSKSSLGAPQGSDTGTLASVLSPVHRTGSTNLAVRRQISNPFLSATTVLLCCSSGISIGTSRDASLGSGACHLRCLLQGCSKPSILRLPSYDVRHALVCYSDLMFPAVLEQLSPTQWHRPGLLLLQGPLASTGSVPKGWDPTPSTPKSPLSTVKKIPSMRSPVSHFQGHSPNLSFQQIHSHDGCCAARP